ncbi:MAG: PEP-CTERM sorting domain-containing protein [Aeoliella sp.]
MLPLRRFAKNLFGRAGLIPLVVAAIMLMVAPTTYAELGDVGFQISLASKEMVLENPDDHAVQMFSAWDSPFQRIADRNMPFVELMNLENSTGNLTEFRLTIGDADYNFSDDYFGDFVMLADSTPGVSLSASTAMAGDELVVSFGGDGLAPGDTVRFRIDLDPDVGIMGLFPHPDFRTVLFDMNDMDGNGMTDNSTATASFEDPNDDTMTATAVAELIDYTVTGPQALYFNQVIRPYSQMEGVDIFRAQGLTEVNMIPEPSTAGLAVSGLLAAAALVRRHRRLSSRLS